MLKYLLMDKLDTQRLQAIRNGKLGFWKFDSVARSVLSGSVFANTDNTFPSPVVWFCDDTFSQPERTPSVMTFPATEVGTMLTSKMRRPAFKGFSADRALKCNYLGSTLRSEFVRTATGASSFAPPLETFFISKIFSAADWAGAFDFLSHSMPIIAP